MLKAIIFDWHGVLDHTTFGGLIKILSTFTSKSREETLSVISEYDLKYRLGQLDPDEFWKLVGKTLHLNKKELNTACHYLLKIDKNKELWKKLPKLKRYYKLAILSDCPLDKAGQIRKKIDLTPFTVVNFSSETGISKTSPKSFLNIVKALQIKPMNCLHIDDKEKHLLNAKKLGFRTVLFKSVKDLESAL